MAHSVDFFFFWWNRLEASETLAKVDSEQGKGALTQRAALSFTKTLKCNVDSLSGKE